MTLVNDKTIQINPLLQQLRTNPASTPHHDFFENSGGVKLFYRAFMPENRIIQKVIIGCHGMGGDGEYFVLFADQIVEQTSSAFYIMDYRGHGRSEGPKGDIKNFQFLIDDLKEFVEFLRNKHPDGAFFIMGESMGGIVSINFVAQNPEIFSGMIEFAPAVKMNLGSLSIKDILRGIVAFFVYLFRPGKCTINAKGREEVGIKNQIHQKYDRTNPYHLDKVSLRYILQLNKFSKKAYRAGGEIIIPIIIFQGEADKGVSVEGIKNFFQTIKSDDKKLILIPEGYHALFTDPAATDLWDKLRIWLSKH